MNIATPVTQAGTPFVLICMSFLLVVTLNWALPSQPDSGRDQKGWKRRTLVRIGQAGGIRIGGPSDSWAVDQIELNLSKRVNVTNTTFIRSTLRTRMERDGLDGPPIELVRFHVFIHCTSGHGRHMVDFEDYEMRRGTAIWVRPGQVQRWSDIDDGFDADVAVFESSSVPDLPLFDRLIDTAITQLDRDTDRLEQQMSWMADDLEANDDQATAAAVVGVILRLFARHARNDEDDDTPGRHLTTAFIESIERNIGQRSVTFHARQIGASTRSIARATAETFGQQPKDIIDAHVILEAQRRLAWSSDDISTIARALDFSEASNFTKFFRTRTGRAPSTFRATVTSI